MGLRVREVPAAPVPIREPRPDALRLMDPRFISLFLRQGNFCLLPLRNFPRLMEEEQALLLLRSPFQPGKQSPSPSPSLQREDHLKKLPKKGVLG